MKIIYITANLPHGTDEAFIIPEVIELTRLGHEVLVVPRSPRGAVVHGRELLKQARPEALCSANVLKSAAAVAVTAPVQTAAALRLAFGSRSPAVALKNLAVVPKALWLARLAVRWEADHIHCHWAGTTATMTMLASRVSGIPWSLTLHRWDIVENNLLAAKVSSAGVVRFISQDGLRMARAIGIRPEDHVRVLGMGVAIPKKAPRLTRPKPVVLCPARLVEVKGHCFLLEAWRLLRDRGLDAELWLAGDGELRPRLEALSGALGIGGSVKFLGAVPHDRLVRMYEDGGISAVALASIDMGCGNHEGIPVALIEAMSFGIPIVATATGGTAEMVRPGCGLLVPPKDPAALADSLESLLRNETFAEQIAEAGRQRVVACHDIVRVASELATAFASAPRRAAIETRFAWHLSLIVILLSLVTIARAADYYVAVTGSDANSGDSASPFRTVAKGVSKAAPGDNIILRDGVYGNEGYISNGGHGFAAPVVIRTAGTPDAWITLKAENPWGAVLDCQTTSTASLGCDSYIELGATAAYWSFEGLVITRAFLSGIHSNAGASYISVKRCRFEYIGNVNTSMPDGIDGMGGDVKAHDYWIEGNVFHDIGRTGGLSYLNHDHGLYMSASNVTVINNVFYNLNKGWSIQIANGAQNWLIANNTFAFPSAGEGQIMLWDNIANVTIRNNIFYNQNRNAITRYTATLSGCTIDHNIIYGAGGVMNNPAGCAISANSIGADPRFVNATAAPYDFHLQPGSPAIGAGVTIGGLTADFDGLPRSQNSNSYGAGAYEYTIDTVMNQRRRWRRR